LMLLALFLMLPKYSKSMAIATRARNQARRPTSEATSEASMEPQKPALMLSRKPMKARPQAMGWRTMAVVRLSFVSFGIALGTPMEEGV